VGASLPFSGADLGALAPNLVAPNFVSAFVPAAVAETRAITRAVNGVPGFPNTGAGVTATAASSGIPWALLLVLVLIGLVGLAGLTGRPREVPRK
jgi:hypothetical protein